MFRTCMVFEQCWGGGGNSATERDKSEATTEDVGHHARKSGRFPSRATHQKAWEHSGEVIRTAGHSVA